MPLGCLGNPIILKSGVIVFNTIAFRKSLWRELKMHLKQLFCTLNSKRDIKLLTKKRAIAAVADMDSKGASVSEFDCYY